MAKLVIYEELDSEETIFEDFDLTAHRIIIGSSDDSNLILDLPDIDPAHASLEFRNDHWVIQDLGGPGGTILNGQTVDGPQRLKDNDLIQLNTVRIEFVENDYEVVDEEDTAILDDMEEMEDAPRPAKPVSGRIWFGTIAGMTVAIIFAILLVFIALHVFGVVNMFDLLPPGLGG